jgi:Phycobilisome degradation protein nblA
MHTTQLSPEKSFELRKFCLQVDELSREDAIALLKQTQEAYLVQNQVFGQMLGKAWGVLPSSVPDLGE